MGYPVDTSPLVREHRDTPGIVEKWDLYVDGFELATGYSELIDPVIQRARLVEQAQLGAKKQCKLMKISCALWNMECLLWAGLEWESIDCSWHLRD
jgi:lysyl-tRNA synthetase class 2